MSRALGLALGFAASAAAGQQSTPEPPPPAGTYQCHVADKSDGFLDIYQKVAEGGAILRTWGGWIQRETFLDKKRVRREGNALFFLSAQMDSGPPPAFGGAPDWIAIADASVTMHVVTPKRLRGPGLLMLSRPSRTGERYEPALGLSAYGGREEVAAVIPWRALNAFAAGEPELSWSLNRPVGGDAHWAQMGAGRYDMRKLAAVARAIEEARGAMAEQRADYRRLCQYFPPPDHADVQI
jgi:hypothetical protein